jgi:DNA mismatch repair protein MSH5
LQLASVGALIDHLVREQAVAALEDEGIGGLDIRDIEVITLFVLHLLCSPPVNMLSRDQVMQINADALL